jgi:hypothetical protein
MTLDEIRERHHASPFKPFTLRLSSGRKIPVRHPEFMGVPPLGSLIAVWDAAGHLHVIDVAHVEEIDLSPPAKANGRKRRQ